MHSSKFLSDLESEEVLGFDSLLAFTMDSNLNITLWVAKYRNYS